MMGDQLMASLVLGWFGAFVAVVLFACGPSKWFAWRDSRVQRLFE
jgi:hypothetical protein